MEAELSDMNCILAGEDLETEKRGAERYLQPTVS
jgi:hypothetical protein